MDYTEIHMGDLVASRIRATGIAKAEFARRLNTSRQNVNTLLNKGEWTVMHILDASKALGMNFFEPLHACADV